MTRQLTPALLLAFALTAGLAAHAQQEGLVPTQALVNVDAKSVPPAGPSALTVAVNDRKQPLSAWEPVAPASAQVALLIDDGLRESVSRELDNLRSFVRTLAPGVEVLVGYMQYGHVVAAQHGQRTLEFNLSDRNREATLESLKGSGAPRLRLEPSRPASVSPAP